MLRHAAENPAGSEMKRWRSRSGGFRATAYVSLNAHKAFGGARLPSAYSRKAARDGAALRQSPLLVPPLRRDSCNICLATLIAPERTVGIFAAGLHIAVCSTHAWSMPLHASIDYTQNLNKAL